MVLDQYVCENVPNVARVVFVENRRFLIVPSDYISLKVQFSTIIYSISYILRRDVFCNTICTC